MTIIVEKGTTLKVLDHGYVKLIDTMGKDEDIVEAARMSTDRGFISWDHYARCRNCGCIWMIFKDTVPGDGKMSMSARGTFCKECDSKPFSKELFEDYPNGDVGLLDNLWRKKHATPFEMGEMVIEVQAPIMVFREWHRHRTQSYNEFSARYSVMPNLHYLPEASRIQKQSSANKQGSAEALPEDYAKHVLEELHEQQETVYLSYDAMLEGGVAKEVARLNTPVSRYSKMRAKGNIRNWFQFLNLRMRPDAQFEIRQYAEEVAKLLMWRWPKAYALFEEYDLYAAHFSRTELKAIRTILSSYSEMLEKYCEGGMPDIQTALRDDAAKLLSGTKLSEFLQKLEFGGVKILS